MISFVAVTMTSCREDETLLILEVIPSFEETGNEASMAGTSYFWPLSYARRM
jgi:hypothetical protein